MLKTSTRVNIISFTACIVFIGSIFYGQKEYFYNCYEFCTVFIASIVNLRIAGWYIPWRYVSVCILVASVFVYYKIRKWAKSYVSKSVTENGPVLVSGKTLLEIHTASHNIRELSRRLENVEKTTHLVMKQLEAVTKCMTEVIKEGKVKKNNNGEQGSTPETHL